MNGSSKLNVVVVAAIPGKEHALMGLAGTFCNTSARTDRSRSRVNARCGMPFVAV
ncbi:hypothetical protein GCM10023078_28040 [Gibbsiella greigii]